MVTSPLSVTTLFFIPNDIHHRLRLNGLALKAFYYEILNLQRGFALDLDGPRIGKGDLSPLLSTTTLWKLGSVARTACEETTIVGFKHSDGEDVSCTNGG